MQTFKRIAKNTAKSLLRFVHPSWIYGPEYARTLRELHALRIDSISELEEFECRKLTALFETISRQVPYYRDLDMFSGNWRKRDVEEPPVYLTSGGSTALPLGFCTFVAHSRLLKGPVFIIAGDRCDIPGHHDLAYFKLTERDVRRLEYGNRKRLKLTHYRRTYWPKTKRP